VAGRRGARIVVVAVVVALVAGLSLLTIGGPAGAATVPVPIPATIDASGRTDVTTALTAFLQRLPAGAVVSFPDDARYRIEGTVVLTNARGVTIDGHGATFFATTDGSGAAPARGGQRASWPRLRAQWRIRGGSGITLRDMSIKGANPKGGATADAYVPALEGQAGIAIQRASQVTVDGVHISDTYGDGVWVTGGSTDVTVRGSTIERIGRQGVAVVNGQRVVVEGNHLRGISRSVFDLEPPGRAVVQDIRLRDNDVGDYGNFLLAAGGGGPGVNDVHLEGNRVDGGHGVSVFAGIEGKQRRRYHVVDNTGTGSVRPVAGTNRPGLIQLTNLDEVEIRGNRQRVDGVPAVSLDRVCDVTVEGNDFAGADPERQEVAPCGATSTAPPTRSGPAPSTATTPSSAPPVPNPTVPDSSDRGGNLAVVGVLLATFGAGIAVGAAGLAWWRRRHPGPGT
jgi:hypothetical protein